MISVEAAVVVAEAVEEDLVGLEVIETEAEDVEAGLAEIVGDVVVEGTEVRVCP